MDNSKYYRLVKGFVSPWHCERLVKEALAFKGVFYNKKNLASHQTYLADDLPNRTSHAYAITNFYEGPLPALALGKLKSDDTLTDMFYHIDQVSQSVAFNFRYGGEGLGDTNENSLNLDLSARVLFNVQEYFGNAERVPQHMDGELLDFSTNQVGDLDVRCSVRPNQVAVLTLVNDSDGGGTRLHFPDGTDSLVEAKAGDLLIFNNIECYHSVDPLKGEVKRPDGLLRMIIGWRSLDDATHYYTKGEPMSPLTREEAVGLTEKWYKEQWPLLWEKMSSKAQKAAF